MNPRILLLGNTNIHRIRHLRFDKEKAGAGKKRFNNSAGQKVTEVMEMISNQPLGTMRINNKFHVDLASGRQYVLLYQNAEQMERLAN